jgi:hypothetical protein
MRIILTLSADAAVGALPPAPASLDSSSLMRCSRRETVLLSSSTLDSDRGAIVSGCEDAVGDDGEDAQEPGDKRRAVAQWLFAVWVRWSSQVPSLARYSVVGRSKLGAAIRENVPSARCSVPSH